MSIVNKQKEINAAFFPGCKDQAGKTTSKVRNKALRKDFHYDQQKYICNLTSLVHTFAVHKDEIP